MKIMAIASHGGHWVQLTRMTSAFYHDSQQSSVTYFSTSPFFHEDQRGRHLVDAVPECNLNEKLNLLRSLVHISRKIMKLRPDLVITTGAAPGLLAIVAGRIMGARTIWIDSIANAEVLSLSGRAAQHIANECFTQWPALVNKRVKYIGSVL